MTNMHRICICLTNKQVGKLKELSNKSEISVSEWLRCMLDFSMQENVLNQLKPTLSGSLNIGAKAW